MDRNLPQLDEELCSRCGLCVSACPCSSVELEEDKVLFSCPEVCSGAVKQACSCGCLCEEVCPTGAISVSFEIVLDEGDKSGSRKGKTNGKDL